ncbi:TLP18.3/Psb32/MOLO-1 phosphatase superfamily protein [Balneicella halophila]|uniref:TLP18.3/Psb32/MOLO-1 phosphatase superfamily protein n=1 Tax=Balneicella halophila TaxID=1537566 RepID=A0A7L4UPT8_BALHA|nr:TPM domain-containing protein [Balneicella halophila]PVX51788.1 TLP18.3/Psb32/MOLO-1 phosphatase superfamily protein [Balneicella halophila]
MEENTAKNFFSLEEQKKIVDAIKKVELRTSSELRFHIDTHTELTALDRAAYLFKKMKMHKTKARNGVLLYMSVQNKLFAIIGDAGIHQYVKDEFWNERTEEVLADFKVSNFCQGVVSCILKVGDALQKHFPYQENDVNELPDEITFE